MSKDDFSPVPARKTVTKEDYARIYRLLESGTSREMVCEVFGVQPKTLWNRIEKDRPDLHKKLKRMPTAMTVPADPAVPLEKVIEQRGRRTRDSMSEFIEHDMDVLASEAREQRAAKIIDPNRKLTPVALKHAKEVKALAQTLGMVPHSGIDARGSGGPSVNVTLNHAQIMRQDSSGLLAEDIPFDAFVEIQEKTVDPTPL